MSNNYPITRHFNSANLYQGIAGNGLPYLLGFCAFVFILVTGALLTLLLWQQAGHQSRFNYNEFYILMLPTQIFLAIAMLVVLWASALIVRLAYMLMLEKNRRTLELLRLIGAEDDYIINSFHRTTFKPNMAGACLGAGGGCLLLWGFRLILLFRFSDIHSLLPKINAIDLWLVTLWLVTVSIFGVLLIFNSGYVVRKFLK